MQVEWYWVLVGILGGGLLFRLIDYLIAWVRERREQKASKTAHEKNRPRFRVDVTIVPTNHAAVTAAVVKILSLGSLPLTINQGKVFICSSDYPEAVETKKLDGCEIGPLCPIETRFPLPPKFINPIGDRKPEIKIVGDFSCGENQQYRYEKTFNRKTGHFEDT
jgi:hypothetical protein